MPIEKSTLVKSKEKNGSVKAGLPKTGKKRPAKV
jgi:hypothetical protein